MIGFWLWTRTCMSKWARKIVSAFSAFVDMILARCDIVPSPSLSQRHRTLLSLYGWLPHFCKNVYGNLFLPVFAFSVGQLPLCPCLWYPCRTSSRVLSIAVWRRTMNCFASEQAHHQLNVPWTGGRSAELGGYCRTKTRQKHAQQSSDYRTAQSSSSW